MKTRHLILMVSVAAAGCRGPASPVAQPGADRSVPAGSFVRLDGQKSADPKGGELAFQWAFASLPPGSAASFDDPAGRTPGFLADVAGEYDVALVVRVGDRVSRPARVRVTAGCGLAPPAAALTADPAAPRVGQPVRLAAAVTDLDNGPACNLSQTFHDRWSIVGAPPGSHAALSSEAATSPYLVPDVPGAYEVVLEVTDSAGVKGRAALQVTAGACGSAAPEVTVTSDPPAGVGEPVGLRAQVHDADNDPGCGAAQAEAYAWKLEDVPAGSQAHLSSGTAEAPYFVPDAPGNYLVGLTVTDDTGRSGHGELAIAVSACGAAAPVIRSAGASPAAPNAGQWTALSAVVADPDNAAPCSRGEAIAYAWQVAALPAGSHARLTAPTAPAPNLFVDLPGHYEVALVTTDSAGHASAPSIVSIDASTCGAASPAAAIAAPSSVDTGAQVGLLANVTDADSLPPCSRAEAFTYRWTLAALPAGSRAALAQPSAASPWFIADVPGRYGVMLVVTDLEGHASQPAFAAIDASVCGSAAPVAAMVASTVSPAVGQAVQLSGSSTDADNAVPCSLGQAASYAWSLVSLPLGSRAALSSTVASDPSFVPDVPGNYVVQLIATDSTGRASAPVTAAVIATSCGANAPSATIQVAPGSPIVGAPLSFTALASDADNGVECGLGQALAVSWRLDAAPPGSRAKLDLAAGTSASLVPDLPGNYAVIATVTDSTGRTSGPIAAVASVSTCGANAPTAQQLAASPASPSIGQPLQLSAAVDDADITACGLAQELSYAWSFELVPPGSAARLTVPNGPAPWFVPDVPGTYRVRLVVADSTGRASAPATLDLTVQACGSNAPVASIASAPASVNAGGLVSLTPTVTDADTACGMSEPFTYGWRFDAVPAGSQTALRGATTSQPSFVADVPGTYRVRLVATDPEGHASAPAFQTIVVSTCGANAPVVSATLASPAAPHVGQAVQLSGTFTDADNTSCTPSLGQTFTYRWSMISLPAGSQAQVADPGALVTSFVPDVAGTYVLALIVTDSTGRASAPATLTFTAGPCGGNAPTVVASASGANAIIGLPFPFTAVGSDADNAPGCALGQTLSYAWMLVQLPLGSQARLNDPFSATPWFTPDVAGTYTAAVVVTDSTGRTSTIAQVSATANGCGGAAPNNLVSATTPANGVTAGPASNVTLTVPACTLVALNASATNDPDSAAGCGLPQGLGQLSIQWSELAAPVGSSTTLQASASQSNPWFMPDVAGTYVFRMSATDPTGRTGAPPATVTLQAAGSSSGLSVVAPNGIMPSQFILGGVPRIAWYDMGSRSLEYAECTGGCTSGNSTWSAPVTIDGASGDVGLYPSLTSIAGVGGLGVAYYDRANKSLRYAQCSGTCTSAASWTKVTVDAGGGGANVGAFASLAAGGVNAISYYDVANRTLKYAECTNTCTKAGNWTKVTLDASSGDIGQFTSIALTSVGQRQLAYYDAANGALRYAQCSFFCTFAPAWSFVTVEGGGVNDFGQYASLATTLGGTPRIAYYDAVNNALRYAECNGSCTASPANWSRVTVDTGGGSFASLQVSTSDGQPRISYYDNVDGFLRYASRATGTWATLTLDGCANTGAYTSLFLNGTVTGIGYYDVSNNVVRYFAQSGL